ncbi:hydroxyacylglutathione hydrolase [Leptospira wolffii]|uniref:hydroxyacylglutathione hydrolase n=1 Tax=Leptospira wolffii TaxID=409998 RepID=A0ABV5BQ45_9LEPT|nr:hydroxyacylglutathione hydrolase [Leptospira wolffii]TGL53898.1 hydroxyacylglutathione hydrolase [Leptospira wolffii]
MLEIVRIYTHSPLRNFSYLVRQKDTGETLCIDPYDSEQIRKVLESKSWDLNSIVNTHEHPDHTSGNEGLVREFGSKILAHPNAISKIPGATVALGEKERILSDSSGDSYLEVLYTPGHTFAHVCLLEWENGKPKSVFTGDTIFNSGVGNCKNGGNPEALYSTVSETFRSLPGAVRLYPGHDYLLNNLRFSLHLDPENGAARKALQKAESLEKDKEFWTTDFSEEREFNPFFLVFQPKDALVQGIRKNIGNENLEKEPKALFLALRSLRDKW